MKIIDKIRERLRSDPFMLLMTVEIAVTVGGGVVVFIFMAAATPGLLASLFDLFWRAFLVSLVGGAYSLISNFTVHRSFQRLATAQREGTLPLAPDVARVRAAAVALPRELLIMTLWLWPAGVVAIGLWMLGARLLAVVDVVRLLVSALLYAPIQGLIIYYSVRQVMRRVGEWYVKNRWPWFEQNVSGMGIRRKLAASFICLAGSFCVAGVLITEAERERLEVSRQLELICGAIERLQAEAGTEPDVQSWGQAIEAAKKNAALPEGVSFLISDQKSGKWIGTPETSARLTWYKYKSDRSEAEAGRCEARPIPGERRFVAMRYFKSPGVWIVAAVDPFPQHDPFWSRYGGTLILIVIVFGLGSFMGYLAAVDVSTPIQVLAAAAEAAAAGRAARIEGFLPGDEIGELAANFNAVVASFHRELSRSEAMMGRVREIVTTLGDATARIREITGSQQGAIDEHTSLAEQTAESAHEVTMAADVIKERAHHTQYKMEETSSSIATADGLIREVLGLIDGVLGDARRLFEEMQSLEHNYRRMEEVMRIIEDIAERSEILALNATLESGGRREGSGARFGVVAGEVRRLSERIAEQAGVITKIFRDVRRSSLEMAGSIEQTKTRTEEGPQRLKELAASLEAIDRRAGEAKDSMNEIVGMAEDQSKSLDQMKYMVAEVQSLAGIIDSVAKKLILAVRDIEDQGEIFTDLLKGLEAAKADRPEPK